MSTNNTTTTHDGAAVITERLRQAWEQEQATLAKAA